VGEEADGVRRAAPTDLTRRSSAPFFLQEREISLEQNRALEAQATKRIVIRFHPQKFSSWDHSKM